MNLRTPATVVSLIALATCGWLAYASYDAERDPVLYLSTRSASLWYVGPSAPALRTASRQQLTEALRILNDRSRTSGERLGEYREHLRSAERLLLASLRTRPTQARALSHLAAVRWELDPPVTDRAVQRHLQLVDHAARMAPTRATVQQDLGEVLLKMARRREALAYLRRAVELEPPLAHEVIGTLREHGLRAPEILDALPRTPASLVALQPAYLAEDRSLEYADLLESHLADADPSLLLAYSTALRRSGDHERLRQRLDELGPWTDPLHEAERLRQLSGAQLTLGASEAALANATRALELNPDSVGVAEHLGRVALGVGRAQTALEAFRRALASAAKATATPETRARLYSEIGRAQEQLSRIDRAYDAYRMALTLDPTEQHARARVLAMKAAAGL